MLTILMTEYHQHNTLNKTPNQTKQNSKKQNYQQNPKTESLTEVVLPPVFVDLLPNSSSSLS